MLMLLVQRQPTENLWTRTIVQEIILVGNYLKLRDREDNETERTGTGFWSWSAIICACDIVNTVSFFLTGMVFLSYLALLTSANVAYAIGQPWYSILNCSSTFMPVILLILHFLYRTYHAHTCTTFLFIMFTYFLLSLFSLENRSPQRQRCLSVSNHLYTPSTQNSIWHIVEAQ